MELFRISTTNATDEQLGKLHESIHRELNQLHTRQWAEKINVSIESSELVCRVSFPRFRSQKEARKVYERVSLGIAEYVLNEHELPLVQRLIRREHHPYNREEIKSIERYCTQILHDQYHESERKDGRIRRKRLVAQALEQYLKEHPLLIVDGFIQFRLPEYHEELRDVVEYAIDEFLMEKQYQEFISLLKYFVDVQDKKVSEVHIIHKHGNEFIILDEQLKPLENDGSDSFLIETVEKDSNYEDMIISSLISISPEKVYIHAREQDLQVIQTIQHIFEDQTELCNNCSICLPVLNQYSLDRS